MHSPTGHHRSPSAASRASNNEPSQTHHHSILPTVPTPALVESVAGGAHYSGSSVEPLKHRHSSHDKPDTHTNTKPTHERVLADIRSLYECHPTPEIFQRSWHKDAVFEVWRLLRLSFRSHSLAGPALALQGLPRICSAGRCIIPPRSELADVAPQWYAMVGPSMESTGSWR
jgi:hypothetical protein